MLEKALVILEPHIDGTPNPKNNGATLTNGENDAAIQMCNRFDGLEIEDFDDLEDLDQVIASIELANTTPGRAVVDVFELEEESTDVNISMMIFCFFEDLHVIQDFLHGIWKSYKNDETSLIVASFTTNAALHLVRKNEEEIPKLAPDLVSSITPKVTSSLHPCYT